MNRNMVKIRVRCHHHCRLPASESQGKTVGSSPQNGSLCCGNLVEEAPTRVQGVQLNLSVYVCSESPLCRGIYLTEVYQSPIDTKQHCGRALRSCSECPQLLCRQFIQCRCIRKLHHGSAQPALLNQIIDAIVGLCKLDFNLTSRQPPLQSPQS